MQMLNEPCTSLQAANRRRTPYVDTSLNMDLQKMCIWQNALATRWHASTFQGLFTQQQSVTLLLTCYTALLLICWQMYAYLRHHGWKMWWIPLGKQFQESCYDGDGAEGQQWQQCGLRGPSSCGHLVCPPLKPEQEENEAQCTMLETIFQGLSGPICTC